MRTIADFIALNAKRHPQRDALVDASGSVSHGELSERVWRLAGVLAQRGIEPGETVAVLAANGRFCVEAFLAAQAAGAVAVMLNWRWATTELASALTDSEADLALVDQQNESALDAAIEAGEFDRPPTILREGEELDNLATRTAPLRRESDPEGVAAILYTGGTTGTSKGVLLSHRALLANALNEIIDCGIAADADHRGLITTPMYHAAALACWFLPHYVSGATSVFITKFGEEECIDRVERERITTLFVIPNMLRRLLKAGALETQGFRDNLLALHTGGSGLRMPDKIGVHEALPGLDLYFRYGLTEAGPMVTRVRPEHILDPLLDGSIGSEYLLTEVQVQDESGAELPNGEIGEICVRGPNLMTGYHNRPEETAAALAGGWLHTGDLAERDERGFFYFRDRSKDMIKTGGENVYSAEVEQILGAHPAVMEAAVLGVPSLDWDEEVRAVVALRPGQRADEEAITAFLRESLAGYKVPKRLAFLDPAQIPISSSGKVLKAELSRLVDWNDKKPSIDTPTETSPP